MSDSAFPDPPDDGSTLASPDASRLIEDVPPSSEPESPAPPRVVGLRPSEDPELTALVLLRAVLEPLDPGGRRRVLRWIYDRYGPQGSASGG